MTDTKKTKKPKRLTYLLYNLYPLKDGVHTAVLCLDCGWLGASWSGHDYRTCPCPNGAMIDGGFNYVRFGAANMGRIQLLTLVPDGFIIKAKRPLKVVKSALK